MPRRSGLTARLPAAQYVFMDMSTYEETRVPRSDDWAKYMKEGMEVSLLKWNGNVISVDVPNTVDLAVVTTDPGVKGNTASGAGGTLPEPPVCCRVFGPAPRSILSVALDRLSGQLALHCSAPALLCRRRHQGA